MNLYSFEDKDPRFARLKSGLALRLLNKGLFYIRAMALIKIDLRKIVTPMWSYHQAIAQACVCGWVLDFGHIGRTFRFLSLSI